MERIVLDLDYEDVIVEEIALEGLDGITLSALWKRLKSRPHFNTAIDVDAKNYFWSICVEQHDFQFFELPEARGPLIIADRLHDDDEEEPAETGPEIYPFGIIQDPHVWGSCSTYHTRVNVTELIRSEDVNQKKMSLTDAELRWGEKLVIVASYETRKKVLLGEHYDPLWQMKNLQYVTLERIGRSRYQGEFTTGKNSLAQLMGSSKSLFYYRTSLLKKGVISKQYHYFRPKEGNIRNAMLLHLNRFYVEHKSMLFKMLEEACKYLLNKPGHMDLVQSMITNLKIKKKDTFRKCIKKIADIKMIPYCDFKSQSEENMENRPAYSNKLTRVAVLYDNVNLETLEGILEGNESKEFNEEDATLPLDNEIEDCPSKEIDLVSTPVLPKFIIPDASHQIVDQPLLRQAYALFNKLGSRGSSVTHLASAFGVPRLESRLICNNLQRLNLVTIMKRDVGKQRESVYVARRYANDSRLPIFKECEKIIDFAADVAVEIDSNPVGKESSNVIDEGKEKKTVVSERKLMTSIKKMLQGKDSNSYASFTLKTMKRMNIILEAVHKAKLIDSHVSLHKLIVQQEAEDGGGRMDLKSFQRIIKFLHKEGFIKRFQTVITSGTKEKMISLICDPSLQADDSRIQSAIEQAKLKFLASTITSPEVKVANPIQNSITQLRNLYKSENGQPKIYSNRLGRSYGHEPKFIRCRLFNEFLFYLTFGYEGKDDYPTPERIFDCETNNLPRIYHSESEPNWKMFISPLPNHYGWNKGWCLMSDVLLRLPLSLLVRIVCFNYKIYGMEEYLNHPVKRHTPIPFLPTQLRNQLLHSRKYIFSAFECAQRLYYMGLLSFCPIEHKSKDMIFIYVHRNARVVDTSLSRPSYQKISDDVEYPIRRYFFDKLSDCQLYWNDLELVCRSTPLGLGYLQANETIKVEILEKKMAIEPIESLESDETKADNGIAPGDQRGAGGLDSAFHSHLNRSWNWNQPKISYVKPTKRGKIQDSSNKDLTPSRKAMVSVRLKNYSGLPFVNNGKNRMARLVINKQLQALANVSEAKGKKKRKLKQMRPKKTTIRQVKPRKQNRIRMPKYDDVDKTALARVIKKRVNWTPKEDSLLLLGKVAYVLMFDHHKNSLSCRWIRDFLHSHSNISLDKTALACQRRINYMLKNLQTGYNVSVYVGEARQDTAILEQCKGLDALSPFNDRDIFKVRFDAIMAILLSKYQTNSIQSSSRSFELPSTLDALRSMYEITCAKDYWGKSSTCLDVDDKDGIMFHLATTLILSAVAGFTSDEQQMSIHLYEIFKNLPDKQLLNALNCLKSSGVICCKKSKVRRKQVHNYPIFGTLTYRLSISYTNMLRSKYPEWCFGQINDMQHKLYENALVQHSEPLNIVIDQEAGYALTIVSLMAAKKIDFDFTIPDEIVTLGLSAIRLEEPTTRPEEAMETNETQKHCIEDLPNNEPPQKKLKVTHDNSENVTTKKANKDEQATADVNNLIQTEKVQPESLNEEPSKKKQKLKPEAEHSRVMTATNVDETSINVQTLNLVKVESAHSKVAFKPASKSSRLALYMLRQEMEEINLKTIQHTQDYLVIKPCIVNCKLNYVKENIAPKLKSSAELLEFLPAELKHLKDIVKHYRELGKDELMINVMTLLYNEIHSYGELGITYEYLKSWYSRQASVEDRTTTLMSHLQEMETAKGILLVGVSTLRYVAHVHSRSWQLKSFQLPSDSSPGYSVTDKNLFTSLLSSPLVKQQLYFCPKVWRRPDGSLNVPFFRQLLIGVMARIMSFPGTSFEKLYTHFRNILNPFQLNELLNMVFDLGCIKKIEVQRSHKATLFSSRPQHEMIVNNDEILGSFFYETEVDGPQKLASYLYDVIS